jgi:hypothetical protein
MSEERKDAHCSTARYTPLAATPFAPRPALTPLLHSYATPVHRREVCPPLSVPPILRAVSLLVW